MDPKKPYDYTTRHRARNLGSLGFTSKAKKMPHDEQAFTDAGICVSQLKNADVIDWLHKLGEELGQCSALIDLERYTGDLEILMDLLYADLRRRIAAIAEAGIPAPKPAKYELPSSSNLDPWLTRALRMSMLQAYDWPNMSGEAILVLIKAAGEKLENKEISEHNAQVILDVLYQKLRETQDRG